MTVKGTSPSGRTVLLKGLAQERTGRPPAAPPPAGQATTPRPSFNRPCELCRQPWKPQVGALARMRCGCQEWVKLQDGKWVRVE